MIPPVPFSPALSDVVRALLRAEVALHVAGMRALGIEASEAEIYEGWAHRLEWMSGGAFVAFPDLGDGVLHQAGNLAKPGTPVEVSRRGADVSHGAAGGPHDGGGGFVGDVLGSKGV
jgi:hypothetical protein